MCSLALTYHCLFDLVVNGHNASTRGTEETEKDNNYHHPSHYIRSVLSTQKIALVVQISLNTVFINLQLDLL